MAEANQLEKTAQQAPQIPQQEKKEEKKPVGTLESVVNETWDLAKAGTAIAAPLGFGAAFPAMRNDGFVLSGAQVVGDYTTARKRGQKFTKTNALESSLQGLALTPVAAHPQFGVFPLINKIPTEDLLGYVTKGAVWGGVAYPIYMGLYQLFDYLIKNRTFKGLGTYMKKEYWPVLKTAWKYLFPISLLNIFFVPTVTLQIAVGALLSYGLTLFGAPKRGEVPEEQKRDKTPYLVVAPKVLGRLAYESVNKLVYNPLKALYEIGSNLYKTAPAKTETPTNAQAAAQGAR